MCVCVCVFVCGKRVGVRGEWGRAGVSWVSCSCMAPPINILFFGLTTTSRLPPYLSIDSSQTWMSPFAPYRHTSTHTQLNLSIHPIPPFTTYPPHHLPHHTPMAFFPPATPTHTTTNTHRTRHHTISHNITQHRTTSHNITTNKPRTFHTNRPHSTLTTRGPCRAPPRRPRRCRRRGWSGARARWSGRRGGAAAQPPPAGSSLCPPRGAR